MKTILTLASRLTYLYFALSAGRFLSNLNCQIGSTSVGQLPAKKIDFLRFTLADVITMGNAELLSK